MAQLIYVDSQLIERHISALAKIGCLGPNEGFTRAAWSDEESTAMNYIAAEGKAAGFQPWWDAIGNLFLTRAGSIEQILQIGSHLDTVPGGGNYDGTAGIAAGLEALKAVSSQQINAGLELVVWRGEESATFGAPYKGSKGAFGEPFVDSKGRRDILANEFCGVSLEKAMRTQGDDPQYLMANTPTLTPTHIENITGHIELHIEQGPVLENSGKDIGIVTAIRGNTRHWIDVEGEFNHSGTTPMKDRKDANTAIAHMIAEADKMAWNAEHYGNDITQTVGILNAERSRNETMGVYHNALTKVPGCGYFSLEIRSANWNFLQSYTGEVMQRIEQIAKEKNVKVNIIPISAEAPVTAFSSELQAIAERKADELGYASMYMQSGAGHDCAVVARQRLKSPIPTLLIFIPCRDGKSHCKEEYASPDAITKGANVLANTVYELAR